MSDIVRAREKLMILTERMKPDIASEVRLIIKTLMVRQRRVRKAPVTSAKVTPATAAAIRAYAARKPTAPMADIARKFNVNQGRVSEVLNGKTRNKGKKHG